MKHVYLRHTLNCELLISSLNDKVVYQRIITALRAIYGVRYIVKRVSSARAVSAVHSNEMTSRA